jgi:hypothetical protein
MARKQVYNTRQWSGGQGYDREIDAQTWRDADRGGVVHLDRARGDRGRAGVLSAGRDCIANPGDDPSGPGSGGGDAIAVQSDDAKIDNLDEVMVKAGAVPGNAVLDGTDGCWVQSQWGGCIAFKSSFIKSSGERYMEMKLYGIRPAVCARIVPFDEAGNGVLGGGRTYAAVYSESSGKLVDGVNGWHSIAGGALTPAKAGALCSYADGTDDVYVVVTWRWNS